MLATVAAAASSIVHMRFLAEQAARQRTQGQAIAMAAHALQAVSAADFIAQTIQQEVADARIEDVQDFTRRFDMWPRNLQETVGQRRWDHHLLASGCDIASARHFDCVYEQHLTHASRT